ncbi:MAG: 2-C-methyl-D-erythritol 4-phosphate cytidylyltransferase [Clostridia bacterium]|jgi:2-C-methyl-D-erythritol 4-phosphate cytidylyltransferase|nr:2-C-methyl-D-erythritol 4-phosphate cytidylyltransferase [Clostridia bacterium]
MKTGKVAAIILAAGSGKRMESNVPKQYLEMGGKPILYYSLKAFEESSIDEIILVVGEGEGEYCRKEIIEKYQFLKVNKIVTGGKERYNSVYNGLKASSCDVSYVLIHDGARPFITIETIEEIIKSLSLHKACVVGVPVKDTIKLVNTNGNIENTPDRNKLWAVQTPQAFSYELIKKAYDIIMKELEEDKIESKKQRLNITDDAMILEYTLKTSVRMIKGDYKNIKITTPEDILVGEVFLKIQ